MYEYQLSGRYFAQVADDIKDIAETELCELGATETCQAYRGIYFNADPESLYRINLESRLINRDRDPSPPSLYARGGRPSRVLMIDGPTRMLQWRACSAAND